MNHKSILALALASMLAAPAIANDTAAPGDLLESINMYAPEEGEPACKIKANENYGTQWAIDVAYGYWHSKNAQPGYNNNANLALLRAYLVQRLVEDNVNGGTWIRAEFSGTWGLDKSSAKSDRVFTDAFWSATDPHFDNFGPHDGVIPELAIMHYFAGKRACIIAGMVNLTNYFDAVGPANDSFASFTNCGFINSSVLALPDANLGAVVQMELDYESYAMLGFSREVAGYRQNPFKSGSGYLLVGEYGRSLLDGAAIIRINPFFRHAEDVDGHCNNYGIAASIEYEVCDELTVFARAGWGARQELGNAFDFSCGANVKLIPSREDDFLGVAFGVFKGCTPTENNREFVTEAMYSFQVNDYIKIVPHIQYIANPAYDAEHSDELLTGVQAVFSF